MLGLRPQQCPSSGQRSQQPQPQKATKCFLCCTEIAKAGQEKDRHKEDCSFILTHVLELPQLDNYLERIKSQAPAICYCIPCSRKIANIKGVLEELEELEKALLDAKNEIEMEFRRNSSARKMTKTKKELDAQQLIDEIRHDIIKDLRSSAISLTLEKLKKKQIGKKPKAQSNVKIMKSVSILKEEDLDKRSSSSVLIKITEKPDLQQQDHSAEIQTVNSETKVSSSSPGFESHNHNHNARSTRSNSKDSSVKDRNVDQFNNGPSNPSIQISISQQANAPTKQLQNGRNFRRNFLQGNCNLNPKPNHVVSVTDFEIDNDESISYESQSFEQNLIPEVSVQEIMPRPSNHSYSHAPVKVDPYEFVQIGMFEPEPSNPNSQIDDLGLDFPSDLEDSSEADAEFGDADFYTGEDGTQFQNFSTGADTEGLIEANTFYCEKCGATFNDAADLMEHDKLHSKFIISTPYLASKKSLKRKINRSPMVKAPSSSSVWARTSDSDPDRLTCPECGRSFTSNACLKSHILHIHRGQFKQRCHICHLGCRTPAELRIHLESHSTVRNYECHLCLRKFKQRKNLTAHVKLHASTVTSKS